MGKSINYFGSENHSQETAYLFNYAEEAVHQLGFDYFIFRMIIPSYLSSTGGAVLTNIPPEIMKPYEDNNQVDDNPIISHCRTSLLPIIWGAESCPKLRDLIQKETGSYAWSQALHDHTCVASLITVIRAHNTISDQDIIDKGGSVMLLCSKLHTYFMDSYLSDSDRYNRLLKITAREREILTYYGQGKTASEIGMVLSISSRTVNFHLNSIYTKLGVSNSKESLVIAVKFGLI